MGPHGRPASAHTAGSVLRGRDLDGLSVEEALMPARLVVPEHRHDGAQIYFLLEGSYTETWRGRRHLLSPGTTWLRPPGELHQNSVPGRDPALVLIVTVEERRFASLERRAPEPRALRSLLLDELRAELLREIRSGDAAAALALEGLSLLLLARAERLLARGGPPPPEWLGDAVSILERSYAGSASLGSVSARVGVHPATLAAAFRRYHRTSVGTYVRELRLRHAREALLATRKPLKQIAVEAGFFDQAHLGRCFRRRYGSPPAAFRAKGGG